MPPYLYQFRWPEMELEKRLEDKVREYLSKIEESEATGNIEYTQLFENHKLPDGTVKNVHLVTFVRSVFDGVASEVNFILIDEATEELLWRLTPHAYINISEED
jgi:hypothetical protein